MSNPVNLTQEQVDFAAQQEEIERLKGQVKYFSERVVILRAMLNNLTEQLNTNQPETKEDENDGSAD